MEKLIKNLVAKIPAVRKLRDAMHEKFQHLEHQIKLLDSELVQMNYTNSTLTNERNSLKHDLSLALTEIKRMHTEAGQNYNLRQAYELGTAKVLAKIQLLEYAQTFTQQLLEDHNNRNAGDKTLITIKLYLDLLEDTLTGILAEDETISPWTNKKFDIHTRLAGRDWPKTALTMIGKARMRNLRQLIETVISEDIPGDIIETGVWRGGACIYARAILKAHGINNRNVWVADSFCGLPPPNKEHYPADANDPHHQFDELKVSLTEVQRNFEKYNLLDKQIKFLVGWFKDTLPAAPIDKLAILRLDGDMYESTWDALTALYAKVSPGGFIIIDDYCLPGCHKATTYFRELNFIHEPLSEIDGAAVYWRKEPYKTERVTPHLIELPLELSQQKIN